MFHHDSWRYELLKDAGDLAEWYDNFFNSKAIDYRKLSNSALSYLGIGIVNIHSDGMFKYGEVDFDLVAWPCF